MLLYHTYTVTVCDRLIQTWCLCVKTSNDEGSECQSVNSELSIKGRRRASYRNVRSSGGDINRCVDRRNSMITSSCKIRGRVARAFIKYQH